MRYLLWFAPPHLEVRVTRCRMWDPFVLSFPPRAAPSRGSRPHTRYLLWFAPPHLEVRVTRCRACDHFPPLGATPPQKPQNMTTPFFIRKTSSLRKRCSLHSPREGVFSVRLSPREVQSATSLR